MFPGIYEFRWDAAHVVFLGAFYFVAISLALAFVLASSRSRRDLRAGRADRIRWHQEFHDLPAASRACRHELAGRVEERTCPNGFDCRACEDYARLAGLPAPPAAENGEASRPRGWFDFPADRRYHRGHAWVQREEDGTARVGLDDLASRLAGEPDHVELPPPGTRLSVNGAAWRMTVRGCDVRVLSPVDGVVVATGGPGEGFYLKVRPDSGAPDDRHLLRGDEVAAWIGRQVDVVEALAGGGAVGVSLADGGVPVANLSEAIPDDRRDEVLGAVLLDP